MTFIFNLLYLIVSGGLFLTTFLLMSKPNRVNHKANNWLSLFLFWLSLIFLEECLRILGLPTNGSFIEEALSLPLFVIAPTFFLSVRHFVRPQEKTHKTALLHLLPVLFYMAFMLGASILADKNPVGISMRFFGDYLSAAITVLIFLQVICYLFLSMRTINTHQKNIKLFASNVETIDLSWLQHFIYGVVFMVLLWFIQVVFPDVPDITAVGYFIAVYYLAYFALNQKEIFPFSEKERLDVLEIIESKPDKAALLPDLATEEEGKRLNELMLNEKPYLDNDLSLPKLAKLFNTSTHQLSHLLNTGFGENFYDYVNRYRVEESKRLLTDSNYRHLSMVGIAFEAGFNSKTAFNTAFKKFAGSTPSGFRKAKP